MVDVIVSSLFCHNSNDARAAVLSKVAGVLVPVAPSDRLLWTLEISRISGGSIAGAYLRGVDPTRPNCTGQLAGVSLTLASRRSTPSSASVSHGA